ncbi:hypothetical protein CY35_17G097200 [Sphagnum magellanicum]|nr:hypothetical protein CY35_17G097200 [Sphagnum magellanicum]
MENIVVRWAQLMIQPAQLKIVAATIGVLIFLHHLFKHFFHQHTKLKRVPGPFPWPVVGNLLMLGKLPHRAFYKLSKKYGDIMELKLGSVRTIVVSSPEMAKQVLKVHDLICASRPETIASKILFEQHDIAWAPYGDHWRHMRKLSMLELLTLKRLEDSKNVRDEEFSWLMHGIFEHCKEGNPVNMQTSLSSTSMNVISRLLFKKRYFNTMHSDEESQEFKDIVMKIMNINGVFNISDYVPFLKPFDLQGIRFECNQILSRTNRFFNKTIQEHLKEKKKANESKNFLDVMLSHPGVDGVSDKLDDYTIKGVAIEIFVTGTDTIATTVEWALGEFIRHSNVVDENDIPQLKYLQAIVKETFRLHPPAPLLMPHENREACEIGGYHIPSKSPIFVNVWAVHRHPSAYENPFDFSPERFVENLIDVKGIDFQLLPFGSGQHICPGLNYGLLMVQIELAKLLHSFTWTLPKGQNPQDIDMGEIFGVSIPKKIPLQVVASARLPLHLYASKKLDALI